MSAGCGECRALLGGYVLHALEPDEEVSVRRHLSGCPGCAAEHLLLSGLPGLLDSAGVDVVDAPVEHPPAALEEAVLDRFAREHPGRRAEPEPGRGASLGAWLRARIARPLPAAVAGALVAAAITAAVLLIPGGSGTGGGRYEATLTGLAPVRGARATAELQVQPAGTRVGLHVTGLRGDPDTVYELWCLRDDGGKVSAGTFRTDGGGSADVNLTTAAVPGEYHRLSIERKAFAPPSQTGERVMAGEILYPHS